MATKFSICVVLFAFAGGVRASDGLTDFSNNLATDLGPLLALFGDAVTIQYLSESTSFLDYFIFAMAPIGIISAVVSTIRVCGSPSLRAFIGRSQEGDGSIQAAPVSNFRTYLYKACLYFRPGCIWLISIRRG